MPKISSNSIIGLAASAELTFKVSKLEEWLASKHD
jgi:hypothetical protein